MSTDKSTTLTADRFGPIAEVYITESRVTEAQAEHLTRFLTESRKRCLSTEQMADALGVSATTVSRVYRGKYDGVVATVADRAALALRLWGERDGAKGTFIETTVAKKVFSACDFALTRQTPAIVTGLSQIGKTTAFLEYARRSDATVRYIRIPAATSLQGFLAEVADALGIPPTLSIAERRRRILRTINDRTLLIIDELHELVISSTRTQARRVCEVLREIYDRTKCGLILCGTDALDTDLLRGPDKGYLDQIVQRSIWVSLPRKLPKADLALVTRSFGLPLEVPEDIRQTLSALRMNQLCLISTMARDVAVKNNLPLDWNLWKSTKIALLGE